MLVIIRRVTTRPIIIQVNPIPNQSFHHICSPIPQPRTFSSLFEFFVPVEFFVISFQALSNSRYLDWTGGPALRSRGSCLVSRRTSALPSPLRISRTGA